MVVEVLSSKSRKLRKDKDHIVRELRKHGIDCYTWSPDQGFTPLHGSASFAFPLGGGKGEGGCSSPEKTSEPPGGERGPGERGRSEAADRVWATFVRIMNPASALCGDEERKIVLAALKVATERECIEAIEGCRASGYHMGDNPRGRKYNTISHILRGKRGKRTTREQIDMLRDIREKAIASGTAVMSSIDPALVGQRKDDVRRGFRLKGDPEAQKRAQAAEQWLKEHGVKTHRRADGYPLWPSGGNG